MQEEGKTVTRRGDGLKPANPDSTFSTISSGWLYDHFSASCLYEQTVNETKTLAQSELPCLANLCAQVFHTADVYLQLQMAEHLPNQQHQSTTSLRIIK